MGKDSSEPHPLSIHPPGCGRSGVGSGPCGYPCIVVACGWGVLLGMVVTVAGWGAKMTFVWCRWLGLRAELVV